MQHNPYFYTHFIQSDHYMDLIRIKFTRVHKSFIRIAPSHKINKYTDES